MSVLAGRLPGAPSAGAIELVLLLLLLVLSGLLGLEFRVRGQGDRLDLFDAALAAALVSVPGPEVVVLVALAKAVSLSAQRVPLVKTCFNVAQWACAAAGGSLVLAALRESGPAAVTDLPVLLLALLVVAAVNTASVLVVLAVVEGRGVLRTRSVALLQGALIAAPVNLALGLLFAVIWVEAPATRLAIPVTLVLVHLGTRVWAEQQASTARLVGLQRAMEVLAGPEDLQAAVPRFLEELRRAFACAGVELHLEDERGQRTRTVATGPGAAEGPGTGTSSRLVAELARRGTAVRLAGGSGDPVLLAALASTGWRNCLAAPIRAEGRDVGVLCTHDREGWEGFESAELGVLEAAAAVLGERVRRHQLGQALRDEQAALQESEMRWRVVARILELVARGTPLGETLSSLARTVEEQAGDVWCAVLVRAPSEDLAVAAPSLPAPVVASLKSVLLQALPTARGPAAPPTTSGTLDSVLLEAGVRRLRTWELPCSPDSGAAGVLALCYRHDGLTPGQSRLAADAARVGGLAVDHVLVQQRLAHQAAHDDLTDLPNRGVFFDRLARALSDTERADNWVLVLFLDLDRFKVVNDSLGHRVGDALLCAVARRLLASVRPADTLARFGGDEFAILCEGISDESHALRVVERVQASLVQPFPLGADELFATASIGIALGRGTGKTPETLIEDADTAMYRAKALGGNRSEMFDVDMRSRAVRRLATQSALHRALEREEFRVVYQPTVCLLTGRIEGVEALVRWDRPDHGIVRPADFVPLAEETGLIVPIGAYVLEEACWQASRWEQAGHEGPPPSVSVNLSARQLADPGLVALVDGALQRTGVNPARLSLEITESVLMSDVAASGRVLGRLKALGIRLLVDDFGTGYSSLTYLQKFPVDGLKVDQSFVAGLGASRDALSIVSAVIGLAHDLGLTAVAEGVETAQQVGYLIDLACDVAQGYHFGRPVPAHLLAFGQPS